MTTAPGAVLLAPSSDFSKYDAMYYLKGAAAGGICCSITHGALTPVDVVKTRVQLDPVKVCLCGNNAAEQYVEGPLWCFYAWVWLECSSARQSGY